MHGPPSATAIPERERRFYLEEFAGRTLVVASGPLDAGDAAAVDACTAELVAEGVRVVRLQAGGRVAHWQPDDAGVVAVWRRLTRHGRITLSLPDDHDLHGDGVRLAVRLQAAKLVLLDPRLPRPGVPDPDAAPRSFVSLEPGAAAGEGLAALAAAALAGGVATVSACHPADLAAELLTYAGAGTCYTLGDYTRVGRVGIDDYAQVAELVERGVEEGFLVPRDADAVARLVVNGYGARVGEHHLAGFAALLTEPYAAEHLGELCALSTISRFAGGGVGATLVDHVLRDAAARGLDGVFACTASPSAAAFFRRLGFVQVPQADLPAAKWRGYDPARRAGLTALLHHLALLGPGA
jgi:amino-acid N-acetyltransferase